MDGIGQERNEEDSVEAKSDDDAMVTDSEHEDERHTIKVPSPTYEQTREENIKQNKKLLQKLGLDAVLQMLKDDVLKKLQPKSKAKQTAVSVECRTSLRQSSINKYVKSIDDPSLTLNQRDTTNNMPLTILNGPKEVANNEQEDMVLTAARLEKSSPCETVTADDGDIYEESNDYLMYYFLN